MFALPAASKDKNVIVWDTRTVPTKPVATLGVRAGENRTTHTGELPAAADTIRHSCSV